MGQGFVKFMRRGIKKSTRGVVADEHSDTGVQYRMQV